MRSHYCQEFVRGKSSGVEIKRVVDKPHPFDNQDNTPWSFTGLFKNVTPNVKINVLLSDPKFGAVCHLEHIPRDVESLNSRVLSGIGHWIQVERPDAIMDAVPLARAKL